MDNGERYAGNEKDVAKFSAMLKQIEKGRPVVLALTTSWGWWTYYVTVISASPNDWCHFRINRAEGTYKTVAFINWGERIRYKVM